jgi:flotillin
LKGANLTILNGADGLNDAVATIAGQGAVILRTVLGNLHAVAEAPSARDETAS